MKQMDQGSWNPYVAGALTGVVSVLSVWVAGKYFGASTTFVRAAGMIEKLFMPERVENTAYFIKTAPVVDWQWMFVVGIFVGALIAALSSGSFRLQAVPDMWAAHFGARSGGKRAAVAFIGGAILMFGARMAGGCPSGHGLSGTMQLAVSGYISLVCFFIGGLFTARQIFKGGGKS
ncbi:MAG: YeeE/YedE thiosulfate transporter family protein [Syntrophotalea sp.]|jgi:uncharacterized membrane protein YedE/YeeE|uniref:YeeE/YedE thiosulfate transporter family protein n=1 Tax=Syntrophotalea sp. TaxID=2812029 RepID=UPI003D0FD6E7